MRRSDGRSLATLGLQALKTKLMSKNVAEEIAEKLCESVGKSLEGKRQVRAGAPPAPQPGVGVAERVGRETSVAAMAHACRRVARW